MIEESREGEREFLFGAKDERRLEEIIRILEEARARISWSAEKIEYDYMRNTEINYNYSCVSIDEPTGCGIIFNKDLYGDWKIYRFY